MAGQLEAALSDCDASLRLWPTNVNALNGRALILLKLGKLDDCIAVYNAALELQPKNAESLYGRGIARQKKGDATAGQADVAAANAIEADIADKFARYGV
jgi:tetratricopeptide (TPR) repeat protein